MGHVCHAPFLLLSRVCCASSRPTARPHHHVLSAPFPCTDKLFTPHQRRLLSAERHHPALSSLLYLFSFTCPSFPSSLSPHFSVSFYPSVLVCLPLSCTEPLILSALCKNKHSSFSVKLYLLTFLSFFLFLFCCHIFISICFNLFLSGYNKIKMACYFLMHFISFLW